MLEGIVFDIKAYAMHDGPGIRTTVFFKGCPLNCWWCHNPESKNYQIEKNLSGGHQEKFNIGINISVNTLFRKIIKDEIFFDESGGGVTFSGGEAMAQIEFLLEILKKCKNHGIHTAVDTSGYCDQKSFEKIIPYTDLFLYDIKLMDQQLHKKYTGKSNDLILSNFQYLISKKANIEIRIPLIPGFSDDEENLRAIKEFLQPYRDKIKIKLIPYNKLGESKIRKYMNEDKIGTLQTQTNEQLQKISDYLIS